MIYYSLPSALIPATQVPFMNPAAESPSNHEQEPEVVYELQLHAPDRDEVNGWIETFRKLGEAYYDVKSKRRKVERQDREHNTGLFLNILDRFI